MRKNANLFKVITGYHSASNHPTQAEKRWTAKNQTQDATGHGLWKLFHRN
jgi:hypothetical protein